VNVTAVPSGLRLIGVASFWAGHRAC